MGIKCLLSKCQLNKHVVKEKISICQKCYKHMLIPHKWKLYTVKYNVNAKYNYK